MKTCIARSSLVLALSLAAACQTPSSQSHKIDAGSDVKAVMHACRAYAANNDGLFPESLDHLVERDSAGVAYLEGASAPLRDSWGTPYRYQLLDEGMALRAGVPGVDKRGGGIGADQDMIFRLHSPR